jgi:hypothetical protein
MAGTGPWGSLRMFHGERNVDNSPHDCCRESRGMVDSWRVQCCDRGPTGSRKVGQQPGFSQPELRTGLFGRRCMGQTKAVSRQATGTKRPKPAQSGARMRPTDEAKAREDWHRPAAINGRHPNQSKPWWVASGRDRVKYWRAAWKSRHANAGGRRRQETVHRDRPAVPD